VLEHLRSHIHRPRRERIPSVRCVTLDTPARRRKDSPDVAVGLAQLLGGHLDLPERLVEPLRDLIHIPSDRKEHDRQDHHEDDRCDREGDEEDRLRVQGEPPVRIRGSGTPTQF